MDNTLIIKFKNKKLIMEALRQIRQHREQPPPKIQMLRMHLHKDGSSLKDDYQPKYFTEVVVRIQ